MEERKVGIWKQRGVVFLLTCPWLAPIGSGPVAVAWPAFVTMLCAYGLLALRTKVRAELVGVAMLVAAAVNAIIGLLQYFLLADLFAPWIYQPNLGEAFGVLNQRNQFATLSSIGLAALLLQIRQPDDKRALNEVGLHLRPWQLSFVAVLLALANAASGSRTGLILWIFVVATAFAWSSRDNRTRFFVAVCAFVVYGVGTQILPLLLQDITGGDIRGLSDRFREGVDCESRLRLWSNVIDLIALKPWMGWGWGELKYAHFVTPFSNERFCGMLGNAHNLPLHLAVELGLPTAVLATAAIAWLVIKSEPWREQKPDRQMLWILIGVVMLHSMVEYPLWHPPFLLTFVVCAICLCANNWPQQQTSDGHINVTVQVLMFSSFFALWFYAVWDYWRIGQIYVARESRAKAYQEQTIDKLSESWLFANQVQFAELTMTEVTSHNAIRMVQLANKVMHFSPEPRVLEKLIDATNQTGQQKVAYEWSQRYQIAYPKAHAAWLLRKESFNIANPK